MNEVCVRVAVRVRPLLPREVLHNHQVCVRVVPDTSHVMIGKDRTFPFDYVFGCESSHDDLYEACVHPLVESLIDGYNATVFAYGQTGSGKTYTLGGGLVDEDWGIIGRLAQDVFQLLGQKRPAGTGGGQVEHTVRVSYMELYREELRDLLELHTNHKELHIREDDRGNTVVVGARETVVSSADELLSVLQAGNALRHTGTTGMNEHSSRSHAILSLQLTQRCRGDAGPDDAGHAVRFSKLHLVDLAGSERAGRTGNTGARLKESVYINTGLLALGNVIRALSDPGRGRRGNAVNNNNNGGVHVPYRDAKITRLLRDSLGGTAHTLMVACVSPSHHSMAETLSVLQFAHRARHIRNRPSTAVSRSDTKSCPTLWDPSEARLGELAYEVETLRELLKERERELEKERGKAGKAAGRVEEEEKKEESSERDTDHERTANQEEALQYLLLAHQAAELLEDLSTTTLNATIRQRVKDWQERLVTVDHLDPTNENPDEAQHYPLTVLQLRRELNKSQEALARAKQELQQKEEALRQAQMEIQEVILDRKSQLHILEEERERTRIQTEQLVEQEILIKRLRGDLMTSRLGTSGSTVETESSVHSARRPYSAPLAGDSRRHEPARKIHTSPPAYSLERVMAAFRMRGHLLLAEIEEKEEVYCPFIKQREGRGDGDQKDNIEEEEVVDDDEDEDGEDSQMAFRHSLNRTWTGRQKSPDQKHNGTEIHQKTQDGILLSQRSQLTPEIHGKPIHLKEAGLRSCPIQRRIQELSINMRMKEQLIKELDKTSRDARAIDTHKEDGRKAGVLNRLSLQSQQARAELYHSLQHLRLQRERLQTSLKHHSAGTHSINKEHDGDWLETEEERALQQKAELQELEAELKRREEMLLRREACLQQRSKLENKRLCSSQVLSQNLLRVSMRLESLEEQLGGSGQAGQNRVVTTEELEKERDSLRERRDILNTQLRDGKVLSTKEEHSLLELEEAIEVLEAALDFKNQSIQDRQKQLSITAMISHQSQTTEPSQICNVARKLKKLSQTEASNLLLKYFNKVVRLRDELRCLRLCCEDLRLAAAEREGQYRTAEAALQYLVLDTDRRLTLQQQQHQGSMQLLLKQLREGSSGEAEQAVRARLQQLERELFFYKCSSRQLKKKLNEMLCDPQRTQEPSAQPSLPHVDPQKQYTQRNTKTPSRQTESNAHHTGTQVRMHAQTGEHPTEALSSSTFNLQKHKTAPKEPSCNQTHAQGTVGEGPEITTIRVSRRELREIAPSDLQVSRSATRGRHSVVKTSTESILEDSIELSRKH
ncbi:unnamed protein product [Lota lota]